MKQSLRVSQQLLHLQSASFSLNVDACPSALCPDQADSARDQRLCDSCSCGTFTCKAGCLRCAKHAGNHAKRFDAILSGSLSSAMCAMCAQANATERVTVVRAPALYLFLQGLSFRDRTRQRKRQRIEREMSGSRAISGTRDSDCWRLQLTISVGQAGSKEGGSSRISFCPVTVRHSRSFAYS